MKKVFSILLMSTVIFSCKKDDGGGGATSVAVTGYKLDSGIVAIPTANASVALDYSTLSMASAWKDTQRIPTNTAFTGASYMLSYNTTLLGQTLGISTYYKNTTSTWEELGDDFGNNVNLSLGGTSATIANGTMLKNPSLKLANMPVVYNDNFSSNATSSLNISATTSVITIPITATLNTTATSSNFAKGTLKLNGYTGTMNVVIQKYVRNVATSITANPAFQSTINGLLNQYGFINGQQTVTVNEYRYWVDGKGVVMTLVNGKAYITTGL